MIDEIKNRYIEYIKQPYGNYGGILLNGLDDFERRLNKLSIEISDSNSGSVENSFAADSENGMTDAHIIVDHETE